MISKIFINFFQRKKLDPHIVPNIVKICGGKCVVGIHQCFIYFLSSAIYFGPFFCPGSIHISEFEYRSNMGNRSLDIHLNQLWVIFLPGSTHISEWADPHIVNTCGSKYVVDLDPTLKSQIISIYYSSGPS